MLAAQLKEYDERVNSGGAPPPPKPEPPLLDSLSLSDSLKPPGTRPMYSQSLPSTGGLDIRGHYPPKPRVRPSPSNSNPPLLELPEPSPLSESLLSLFGQEGGIPEDEALTEETGGMSMLEPVSRRQQTSQLAASAPATMLWGASGHRMGSSVLGGRTPSKTLLEAMSAAPT